MNQYFLTVLIVISSFGYIQSQSYNPPNLIPNPGFETGNNGFPVEPGQINKCDNWNELNTADWFLNQDGYYEAPLYSPNADPHNGKGYAGIGRCEGLEIELIEPLNELYYGTISFWFSPEYQENSEIKIQLTDENVPNGILNDYENGNCSAISDEFSDNLLFTINVNAGGASPEHIVGQWYFYESEPFLIEDQNLQWLIVTNLDEYPNDGSIPFLNEAQYCFLDDFSLKQFPACSHPCSGTDGPLTIWSNTEGELYTGPDPVQGINEGENTAAVDIHINLSIPIVSTHHFQLLVENGTEIEFEVKNNWGATIFSQHVYDYNGLHDEIDGVIYDDYALQYGGQLNGGGYISQQAIYNFAVVIYKCGAPWVNIDGSFLVSSLEGAVSSLGDDIQDDVIEPCCPEYVEIQNVVYENIYAGTLFEDSYWDRVDAIDYILAGENVTSGTQGPVVVSNLANVAFFAGDNIILETGFITEAGANFVAEIHQCGSQPKSMENEGKRRERKIRKTVYNVDYIDDSFFRVTPNPVKNYLIVETETIVTDVEIYSITGNKSFFGEFQDETIRKKRIDVQYLKPGLYILVCKTPNWIKTTKFVKE